MGLGLSFPKHVPYGLGPKAELAVFHFRHLSSIPDTQGVWNGRYLPFQTPCLPFQTFCLPFHTFCLPFQTVGCLPFQRPCLPFQPPRCLEWKTKENLVLKPIPQTPSTYSLELWFTLSWGAMELRASSTKWVPVCLKFATDPHIGFTYR